MAPFISILTSVILYGLPIGLLAILIIANFAGTLIPFSIFTYPILDHSRLLERVSGIAETPYDVTLRTHNLFSFRSRLLRAYLILMFSLIMFSFFHYSNNVYSVPRSGIIRFCIFLLQNLLCDFKENLIYRCYF